MMGAPASGNRFLVGLRRERAPGVPDLTSPMIFCKIVPAATVGMTRPENPSGQVNVSGYPEAGLPGAIEAQQDLAINVTGGQLLEFYENLLGNATKTTLEDGVFAYDFFQSDEREPTFELVYAMPPTESKGRLYGLKVDSITEDVANNAAINARMAVRAMHGTSFDEAVEDPGNTGTYQAGPILRGPGGLEPHTPIHIRIERDVAGGGLRYWAEQTSGVPTYPGSPIEVIYAYDGGAVWQNLQVALYLSGTVTIGAGATAVVGTGTRFVKELEKGQYLTVAGESRRIESITDDQNLTLAAPHVAGTNDASAHLLNRDAGYWDVNRDPLEILFPGDAAEHSTIAVGDAWSFAAPRTWDDPLPTYITGHQRLTSAHLFVDWRDLGETLWRTFDAQSGSIVSSRPTSVDPGNGSRYPSALDHDTDPAYTLSLPRKLRDTILIERQEAHRRLQLRVRLEGKQLGTGLHRESIVRTYPYVAIVDAPRPVSGPTGVVETPNFAAQTDENGVIPISVRIITSRDWTPLAG